MTRSKWVGCPLVMSVALVGFPVSSSAQDDDRPDTRVGHASDALPGFGRVGVPVATPWPVAISAEAGYGFTESVLDLDDSHHRVRGRLSASVQPIDYLAVSLQLDGRYDTHSGSTPAVDGDDGLVGDPRLIVRGFYDLGVVALGAQGRFGSPGRTPRAWRSARRRCISRA